MRSLRSRLPLAVIGLCIVQSPLPLNADGLSRADASALLEQFRRSVWAEPLYAEFELRQMPRHGEDRVFHGRFWGARNDIGPITRFEVDGSKGRYAHRILTQGGPDSETWMSDGPGAGVPDGDALLEPLVPGIELTPFDLLPMPYLWWLDAEFVGTERVRGRKACIFMMIPPAEFSAKHPGIHGVRAYLDVEYAALEQSEVVRTDGSVSKTLTILELRKVGPRWIPRDVDVRNEATRDKTRLTLTAVALGISAEPAIFDPSLLGAPVAPPPGDRITRITQ